MKNKINFLLNIILFVIALLFIGIMIYAFVTQDDAEREFFNWLVSMAPIIAAGATLVLAWVAFKSIKEQREERIEERQRRALERIRYWAEDTIGLLTVTSQEIKLESVEGISKLLQPTRVKSMGVLSDGEFLGGDLKVNLDKAHAMIQVFSARLYGKEEITDTRRLLKIEENIEPIRTREEMKAALGELICILTDVITSATKKLLINE